MTDQTWLAARSRARPGGGELMTTTPYIIDPSDFCRARCKNGVVFEPSSTPGVTIAAPCPDCSGSGWRSVRVSQSRIDADLLDAAELARASQ